MSIMTLLSIGKNMDHAEAPGVMIGQGLLQKDRRFALECLQGQLACQDLVRHETTFRLKWTSNNFLFHPMALRRFDCQSEGLTSNIAFELHLLSNLL